MLLWDKKKAKVVPVPLILSLIAIAIIFPMTIQAFNSTDKLTEGQACRLMLGLKKTTEDATGNNFNIVSQKCHTIFKDNFVSDKQITNKYQIEKQFSDKIKNTWHIVHEGTIKDLWAEGKLGSLIGDEAHCVIMYDLNYKPKRGQGFTINISEFNNYLQTAVAVKEDDHAWTYLDYIQSYGSPSHIVLVPKTTYDGDGKPKLDEESIKNFIEPGNSYGIAVATLEKGDILDTEQATATIVGIAAAVLTFASGGTFLVVVAGALAADAGIHATYKVTESSSANKIQSDENAFVLFGDLHSLKQAGCTEVLPTGDES